MPQKTSKRRSEQLSTLETTTPEKRRLYEIICQLCIHANALIVATMILSAIMVYPAAEKFQTEWQRHLNSFGTAAWEVKWCFNETTFPPEEAAASDDSVLQAVSILSQCSENLPHALSLSSSENEARYRSFYATIFKSIAAQYQEGDIANANNLLGTTISFDHDFIFSLLSADIHQLWNETHSIQEFEDFLFRFMVAVLLVYIVARQERDRTLMKSSSS